MSRRFAVFSVVRAAGDTGALCYVAPTLHHALRYAVAHQRTAYTVQRIAPPFSGKTVTSLAQFEAYRAPLLCRQTGCEVLYHIEDVTENPRFQ
jgi:hypothetical protein